ncbi:MAG TPA: hypothetical protein VK435_04290, partial [Thermodesulfovibrionales bacterium]|nr:hypothetical protein [Thermodesulfovibrionales bacterium]
RDTAYMALAARRVETIDKTRDYLINARMHLLYAKTYQFTERDPKRARQEIGRAEEHINGAMSAADATTRKQLSEVTAELRKLESEAGSRDDSIKNGYSNINESLTRLIHNR